MCSVANPWLFFAGMVVMGLGSGLIGPNIYVAAQTFAGSRVTGKWTAMQNACGNLAGVVVGPLTGWIVGRSGSFASAFAICACFAVMGGLVWVFALGRIEPIVWQSQPESLQAAVEAA
jgi:ACS family glucarate transporter-like MFS transporter